MSAAREEILGRVRDALSGGAPSRRDELPGYRRVGSLGEAERVDLFAARVADYRAEVLRVVASQVSDTLAALAHDRTLGVPVGLRDPWRPPGAVADDDLSVAELDRLAGAVTGCTVAIAETGTLVLAGGAEEGRRALTLVPDLHICVVEAGQVVQTVPEAFDRLAALATRPLTFVSGPSATSDIELKRVEGVHGPRQLVVVIVERGD